MNSFRSRLQTIHYSLLTNQLGQSLIETIIAIFILASSLTAGLGLTLYAFTSSAVSTNEIIASNLAREGVEVVRMMRDSNWLSGDVSANTTYNLTGCADIGNKLCYPKTYTGPSYNILSGNQRVVFNSSTSAWSLDPTIGYYLYLQPDGTYTHTNIGSQSVFARMVNVTFNTAAPYTASNSNSEMIVKSVVAWQGKNCPSFATGTNLLTLSSACKVIVEEHMTNWKDYK